MVQHSALSHAGIGVPSGTSFPGSPSDNDLFLRTDLDCELYRYESTGTKWLCTSLHFLPFLWRTASPTGISATTTAIVNGVTLGSQGDMWLVDFYGMLFATATNDGSNYWDIALQKLTAANAATLVATLSTQNNTASNWVEERVAIDAAVVGSSHVAFRVDVTEVGAANSVFPNIVLTWRHLFDV